MFIPERERTLILLSAFINFVKFTEQYCHSFVKDLQARSENINVERDHVYEELSEVQRNIDTVKYVAALLVSNFSLLILIYLERK